MSVINQMLKDLDKRHQPHSLSAVPGEIAVIEPQKAGKSWLWLILAAILLVACVYLWPAFSRSTAEITKSTQLTAQGASLPAAMAEANNTKSANQDSEPSAKASESIATVVGAKPPAAESVAQLESQSSASASTAAVPKQKTGPEPTAMPAKAITETQPITEAQLRTADNAPTREPVAIAQPQTHSQAQSQTHSQGSMAITEVTLSPAALAEKAYAEGLAAQEQGKLLEAEQAYRRALTHSSAAHEARKALVALLYGRGQLVQAAEWLELGIKEFSDRSEFRLLLAKIQLAQGKTDEARTSLEAIADTDPAALDKWLQMAELARRQDDQGLAERAYGALTGLEPNAGRWWLGLAYAQDAQGLYPSAATSYRRALGLDDLSAEARDFMEKRLMQLGESR